MNSLDTNDDRTNKILDFMVAPPLSYSLHLAINLAIILTESKNYDWLYSSFIQICFKNNFTLCDGNHIFCIYPGAEMRPGQLANAAVLKENHIDRTLHNISDAEIINFIIRCIDMDYYVGAILDVSKIPGTRYEKRQFLKHGTIVYGYDKENKLLYMFDFNNMQKLVPMKVLFEDYLKAFHSSDLLECFGGNNNSIHLYKKKINDHKIKNTW